jgi:hypothetical protein
MKKIQEKSKEKNGIFSAKNTRREVPFDLFNMCVPYSKRRIPFFKKGKYPFPFYLLPAKKKMGKFFGS